MGVLSTMFQYLTGHKAKQDAEQAEISKALAFQAAKSDVIRVQLTREISGLRGAEARMHDYFGDLQIHTGRRKQDVT